MNKNSNLEYQSKKEKKELENKIQTLTDKFNNLKNENQNSRNQIYNLMDKNANLENQRKKEKKRIRK